MRPWVASLLTDIGQLKPPPRPKKTTVADVFERIAVLCMTGHLFLSDSDVCRKILDLARSVPSDGDVELQKVRSFAASAGSTIAPTEALTVIRDIVNQRIVK